MQDWVIILVYALVAAAYAVIHELFFRFRFKELFFTFGFLTLTFLVCMFATGFQNVFIWLTTVSIIESILLSVYAAVCMRVARDRVLRKMQGPGGMAEMLNNMMSGKFFGDAPDPFDGKGNKAASEDEEPVIVVTEEKREGESASPEEELKYYDLGDVIIDGSEEHDEDEKED